YWRLLGYARPQRNVFALIGALTFVAAALSAAQPWPVKFLLDRLQKIASGASADQTLTSPFLAVIVLPGLALFLLNARWDASLTWALRSAGRRMVYDLAEDLFVRLQRRSLPLHSRNSVGDSLSRVTVDSWSIYQLADGLLFSPIHALLSIGAMIFLMAKLD